MTQTPTFIKPEHAPWARECAGFGPRETSHAEKVCWIDISYEEVIDALRSHGVDRWKENE